MPQYIQQFANEFIFDYSTGTLSEDKLRDKYNLTEDELCAAVEFYNHENLFELDKLLTPPATEPEPEVQPIDITPPEKPTFGYRAQPRLSYVFVKPLPSEHKGRLVIPKAFESTSDMGFVRSIGTDVIGIEVGNLVLYDKYAETGARFPLVDEDGEVVELIQMRQDNITAILTRINF